MVVVGVLEVMLHIPESSSLKDRRHVVRSLKDRIRARYNVSLAETEGQNTWQTCGLAVAMVAEQKTAVERELNRILELIESQPEIQLTDHWIEYL